jgi:transcriptional regulator of acetoin/glycerol metabolism
MKILLSWMAKNNDFEDHRFKSGGATGSFYAFFNYDLHLILTQSAEVDTALEHLMAGLKGLYPQHADKIQPRAMGVRDVIDIKEIKSKIETLLLEYREHDIDIYYSPGTSAMQVAWYICHTTLNLKTRLLQVRPADKSKTGKAELITVDVSYSTTPVSAVIREELVVRPKTGKGDHLFTPSIKKVYEKAEKIAQTDRVTTLITGASGTGKEQLARHIHEYSARASQPFMAVNCSAFSDTLLESRLFGHKKGAFTDAHQDSKGVFEAARGGTLFLDEIGDITPYMQQSLLRVLQQQEIMLLGSNEVIKTNVRIVAATNRDLPAACESGNFRWDLYYRLTVSELVLPDLAALPVEEKEALTDHLLDTKKTALRKHKKLTLSKAARTAILAYPFPGNIRELENLIEQLYVFYDTDVDLTELPERVKAPKAANSLKWIDVEKLHIEKVMRLAGGIKARH